MVTLRSDEVSAWSLNKKDLSSSVLKERARLKDAGKFEILYLTLPFNKYFKRDLLDNGSLYWQANDQIEKYHFQQNFKESKSNS